jgi:hypothetical protein
VSPGRGMGSLGVSLLWVVRWLPLDRYREGMARLRVALNISATAPTGWIDGAFVLGMASVALLEITVAPGPYSVHDEMVVAVVTAVVLSGGLWWRRRQPLLLAVVAGVTLVVAFQLGLVPQAWLAVYIAILGYSTGAYGRGWQSHAGLVAAVLVGCSIAFFAVNTRWPRIT